jgi:hypothetical protein
MLLEVLIPVAAAAPCTDSVEPAALVAHANSAQSAFGTMDGGAFKESTERLLTELPCSASSLSPQQAAQIHLTLGLGAFLEGDEAGTVASFQAAQAADPELELGAWLPETHPVRLDWRFAARLEPAPPLLLAPPEPLIVDGRIEDELIPGQPAVLQHMQAGSLEHTLLWQGETLPEWAPLAEPGLSPELQRRLVLGATTLALAGGSSALLVTSASAKARFVDPSTPYEDLEALERRANLAGGAAIGGAILTAGVGLTLAGTW